MVGPGEDELPLPRPGHRASLERCAEALGTIDLVLHVGRIGKPKSGYGTIVGQANGQGGRGTDRSALARYQQPRAPPLHRGVWGIEEQALPGAGCRRLRTVSQHRPRRIKGLLDPSIRRCRCPTTRSSPAAFEKLEFFGAIDSSSTTPRTTRTSSFRQPARGRRRDVTQVEGRIIKMNKAVDCPGRGARRLAHHPGHRAGAGATGSTFASARDLRGAAVAAGEGGVADYSGVTYEKNRAATRRLLAHATARTRAPAPRSTTIPARRHSQTGRLQPRRQGQRPLLPRRPRALQRRRLSTAGRRCERDYRFT